MIAADPTSIVHEALAWLMRGFGLFSILYALLPRNTFTLRRYGVIDLDATACGIARAVGLAYIALFFFDLLRPYVQGASVAVPHHQQLFGPYWYVFWLEPLRWLLGTQVLWSERIRTTRWLRLLIGLLLTFALEHLVFLVTSLHRDHLPGTWSFPLGMVVLWAMARTVLFTGFVLLVHLAVEQWRSRS